MIQHLSSDIEIQPAQVKENEFKRQGSNRRKPAAPKSRNVLENTEKNSTLYKVEIPSESYNCDKCFFKTTSLWHFQLHTQHHLTESDNSASIKLDLSPVEELSENDSDEQIFDSKDKDDKCNIEISPDSRAENCSVVQNRKRHYNVEVDPAKYRRIEDPEEGGVKYACSICGNVYKWRKSLNKHWKEKHKAQHPPPLDAPVKIRPKAMTNKTQSIYKNGHGNQMTHPAFMSHACIMPSMTWQNPFFMMPPQDVKAFDNVCTNQQFYVQTNSCETKTNEDAEMKFSDDCPDDAIPLDLSIKKEKEVLKSNSIKTEPNESSNSMDVDMNENRSNSSPTSTDRSGRSFSNENNERLNRNDYSNGGHNKTVLNAYGQKLFVCSVCKAKFLVLDSINDHFLQNHMQELEREIAGKSPPRNTNVAQQNEEWNLSDPKNPLKCIKCDFVGRWPTELQKHAASHSTSRPFKCLVCSLTYKWRWDLAKHFDRAHPSLVNPYKKRDRDAARSMIERTSKDSSAKKRRLDNALPVRPQVIVNPCYMPRFVPFAPYPVPPFPFPFVNSSLFEQHCKSDPEAANYKADQKLTDHAESNDSDAESSVKSCPNAVSFKRKCDKEERNYICKWCDFRGRWRSELIQHMRCHHAREKPYHCSECTYASNWKWDVQKHVKKQHPAEDAKIIEIPDRLLFQSDDENPEDKSNYDEDVWRKIFAQTDPSKVMRCNHCPFMTSSPIELRRHLIVHSDEQPYRCFACIYKSKWKCEVKKHMKLHGHTGPILVGRKAMEKVIEKVCSKMKNIIMLDNVKQAGNEDDYITDEEIDKSNMDESENSAKETGSSEEMKTYECTNGGEDATNGYKKDANDVQDEIRYRCFVCDYSHEDIEELMRHVHNEHENEMWPCSYCQVQSRTLEEAQLHFSEHDSEEKDYLSTIFLSSC